MARFPTGVVIVGGSAAGLSAADGLREGGYDGSVIVLDENIEPGFDRPALSKGLLAPGAQEARPASLRTPERLAAQRVEVLYGHRAVGLDIDRNLVVTSYGEAIPWDHLVIATGVDARRLATAEGHPVPALRTLADLERARAIVAAGRPVTVIGAGFIGLEVAAALRGHGGDVTVIAAQPLALEPCLGPALSAWLMDLHQAQGVRFDLGLAVAAVEGAPGGYRLTLDSGETRQAASLLAGVGVEPNTEWLIGSGVELAAGVVTDPAGRTNVPGVWAVGDVASWPDPRTGRHRRFEHWTHAIEQGRHVGLAIAAGTAEPYGGVPYIWTEQYGRTLHLLGERRPGDTDTIIDGALHDGEFLVLHGSDGELHAVTASGRVRALRTYKKLLRSGASLADALTVAASS